MGRGHGRWALIALIGTALASACGGDEGETASGRDGSTTAGTCANCDASISADGNFPIPDGSNDSSDGSKPTGGSGGSGGGGGTGGSTGGSGGTTGGSGGTAGSGGGCTPTTELCATGEDEDCDGKIDCADDECAFKDCSNEKRCKGGSCVSVFANAQVSCNNTPQTGTSLCQSLGWQSCADAIGYWWFQCAGPGDCPSAWSGLTCSTYQSNVDCVGMAMSGTDFHTASKGCSSAYGATDFGYNCTSYNPGYTVRLRCN